jgi:NADH-quinone oxidoreductase subunit L
MMPNIFSFTIAVFIIFFSILAVFPALKEEKRFLLCFNILVSAVFALYAVFANNFLSMLFFWEGLLVTLYLFLLPYNKETAGKAFLINAAGDIILLAGICLFYVSAKTLVFAEANLTNLAGNSYWAFILIFTGALAKAGAFPFHSWIAPAAKDAPFCFLAMMPAAVEKLLAVFLLGKIFIMLFPILPASARVFGCVLASLTIIIAAAHIKIFKNLKELLAWSVVMQIGLFAFGLCVKIITESDGTYILNHGIFKAALLSCSFFAAGVLQFSCGGTEIKDIKGYAKKDILTTIILIICALGLAGTTLTDILFTSNALLSDAYEAMPLSVLIPIVASLTTLFAFFKVFYAMFHKADKPQKLATLLKLITLISFIPVLFFTLGFEFSAEHLFYVHFAGFSFNNASVVCIAILLLGAVIAAKVKQPAYSFKRDTFDFAKISIYFAAAQLFKVDRVMDKITDAWPSYIVKKSARRISAFHKGNTPQYIIWAVLGIIIFVILAVGGIK